MLRSDNRSVWRIVVQLRHSCDKFTQLNLLTFWNSHLSWQIVLCIHSATIKIEDKFRCLILTLLMDFSRTFNTYSMCILHPFTDLNAFVSAIWVMYYISNLDPVYWIPDIYSFMGKIHVLLHKTFGNIICQFWYNVLNVIYSIKENGQRLVVQNQHNVSQWDMSIRGILIQWASVRHNSVLC